MSQRRSRTLVILVLAVVVSVAPGVAAASGAAGRGTVPEAAERVPAVRLLVELWQRLAVFWQAAETELTPAAGAQGDAGPILDPDGSRAPQGDAGPILDPDG